MIYVTRIHGQNVCVPLKYIGETLLANVLILGGGAMGVNKH